MKIKSLLLGSAAAMTAVTGAQAADAIIVEPEPVEYVRVCDMYGAGYFYIPGTETCLKLSGYVRVQYTSTHDHDEDNISDHDSYARAVLDFDARNETEYGTLGSNIRLKMQQSESRTGTTRATYAGHDDFSAAEPYRETGVLVRATINLAGFRAGYDATSGGAWNRYGGFGFYNANADGGYGFNTALFFEYGGSVGDFGYVVGVQDSIDSGASGQPDPYVGMTWSAGALALGAVVIYDSNGGDDADGDGGVAYRIRADYDLSSFVPGGSFGAWWRADHGDTDYVKGHQWGVTAKMNLTEKLELFAGYSDYNGENSRTNGTTIFDPADARRWTVGTRWNLATGLYIQAEYSKTITSTSQSLTAASAVLDPTAPGGVLNTPAAVTTTNGDSVGAFTLRLHRSF